MSVFSRFSPTLPGFTTPFDSQLDESNRWVKWSKIIPWEELCLPYDKIMSKGTGRPPKPGRLVIGAMILKHKLCLSDEEVVLQIQENPYYQYFVGFDCYQSTIPFVPSLFVEIRKRMGNEMFESFHTSIVSSLNSKDTNESNSSPDDNDDDSNKGDNVSSDINKAPVRKGKLIVDATVCDQMIKYPTDLSLLNESRLISERIIDELHIQTGGIKPRTYRKEARKFFLGLSKQRCPKKKMRRKGIKTQLQYLRRNLNHINCLLDQIDTSCFPLSQKLQRQYWIIQHVYNQQFAWHSGEKISDRIVSISQPYVRPIVRNRSGKKTEFGAKLNVSLIDGIAHIDKISWSAFNEGAHLIQQVENYKNTYGCYPEVVLADTIYGTKENRKYIKDRSIRWVGKPLGRPGKTDEAKEIREKNKEEYKLRTTIEGKFGQAKNGYQLGKIRARTQRTSQAWIHAIFLVMNLIKLANIFVPAFKKLADETYYFILKIMTNSNYNFMIYKRHERGA